MTASNGRFVVMHEDPPPVGLSVTGLRRGVWQNVVAGGERGRNEGLEGQEKGLEGGLEGT